MCMRQVINLAPNEWPIGSQTPPIAVVGDPNWSDYQVSIDALLEQSGHIDKWQNAQFDNFSVTPARPAN